MVSFLHEQIWYDSFDIFHHLGTLFAHFWAIALAEPTVLAFSRSGTEFQTFAITLAATVGYPGTGGLISLELWDRVQAFVVGLSLKRQHPRGSMHFFDFQAVRAVIDATASFRHLS